MTGTGWRALVIAEATCPGADLLVTTLEIDANDDGTIDNTLQDGSFSLLAN
jgi:hypothetical protein